jgi:hypothetical protein
VKPEDLNAEQRRVFDTWRALDMSEATAMAQLRNDGLLPDDVGGEHEAFYRRMGLSEAGARVAAAGRDGPVSGRRATGSNAAALSEALAAYSNALHRYGGAAATNAETARRVALGIWESTSGTTEAREAATVGELRYHAAVFAFYVDKPWPSAPAKPIREARGRPPSSRAKPPRVIPLTG